jgi:N-acetylneuraminic acid mutarotase
MMLVYGQKYKPEPRIGHTAVFIKNELKIYYIGGDNPENSEQNPESDIFYLNVTDPSSWVNLKSQGIKLPHTSFHTANIGGVNQDSIYIIGGAHSDEKNNNYLYVFNTKTSELSVPVIEGKAPQTRIGMNSVCYEGKIYMFGGQTYNLDASKSLFVNQFDILDTINLNWQVGDLVNSPVALSGYTATLVNGIIYYIGGRSQQYVFSPMKEVCK